jgi:hypothetical protein
MGSHPIVSSPAPKISDVRERPAVANGSGPWSREKASTIRQFPAGGLKS